MHCLGKAGSLGGGGRDSVDLPNAAAKTQIVSKTLALSPCCSCLFCDGRKVLRLILDILSGSLKLQFTVRMICTNLILLANLTSLRFSMGVKVLSYLPAVR